MFGKGRHGEKSRFQEQRKDRKMAAVQGMRQQQAPSKLQGSRNKHPMNRGYPSLFAPDSEDEVSSDSDSAKEEQTRPTLLPLQEVIHDAPQSLASLLEILLPRIQPRAEVKGVSIEDQQSLASILVGELASQFMVLQQQIDDPFMTQHQNKLLHKQITVEVCRIVEELYTQYVAKAALIDKDSVFSIQANLSRLRAELTLQANKSLNIPAIRRQLLTQHRSLHPVSTGGYERGCTRLPPLPQWRPRKKTPPKPPTSLEQLKLDEPLKVKMQRFGVRLESRAVKRKIKRLQSKFPAPQGAGGARAVEGLAEMDQEGMVADSESSDIEEVEQRLARTTKPLTEGLRRVSSMPELGVDSLLCDFGLITRQHIEMKDSRSTILGIKRPPSIDSFMDLKLKEHDPSLERESTKLGDYTLDELSKDLKSLQASASDAGGPGVDELNPLLQAHVHGLSEKQSRRLEEFEAELWRQLKGEQPMPPRRESISSPLEHSIPSVSTMEQLPSLPYIPHDSGSSSHPSMLVKSGFSLRSGGASSSIYDKDSAGEFEDHSIGGTTSMLTVDNNNDSLFREPSATNLQPMASHTRASLDPTATLVSLGGGSRSRVSFGDLRQPSVPPTIMLGTRAAGRGGGGESGFLIGEEGEEEEGVEHGSEATPREQRAEEVMLHESQSTLKGSFGSDLAFDEDDILNESQDLFSSSRQRWQAESKGDLRGEEEEKEEEGEIIAGIQPQPAFITTRINEREVVRTNDIRVSERTPLTELRLKPFSPIYNELSGELTSGMIEELDSLLHTGTEITAIYEELTKTLPNDYLQFTTEPTLEPSISQPVDLSKILASNTLHHRRSRRIVNPQLYRDIPHPWGQDTTRDQWAMSNQYQGPDLAHYGIKPQQVGKPLSPRLAHVARKYHTWLRAWRATIDSEDYLKFTSREESDYLHLIYHLYDSEGSDSEAEEEEKQRRARLAALQAKLKAKELRRQQRYRDKSRYQPGVWNVNTVLMGGLGGDPDSSSSSDEGDVGDLHVPLKAKQTVPGEVQKRLQGIWTRLHCPEAQQMDMAIKYSSHLSSIQINQALEVWEETCAMIEKRETALARLETFERAASDPTRFFVKGQQGSSVLRLEEARKRDQYHKELDELDAVVSHLVSKLQLEHGDIVTYKGRPYFDKMRFDRTEMLYWLQQERRETVLRPALKTLATTSPATTTTQLSLPTIVAPVLSK